MSVSNLPLVSVIVPFYGNKLYELNKCIHAINNQSYPIRNIELIIVDNNPSHILKNKFIANNIKVFHEPLCGSYAARNKGISESKGEILAFTDSDCVPQTNWLSSAIDQLIIFKYEAIVGGEVILLFKKPIKPSVVETYDTLFHFRQSYFINRLNFSVTANLVSPKSLFEQHGLFDAQYYSGGDKEWCNRVYAKGIKIYFSKETIVYHYARASLKMLILKNMRMIGGAYITSNKTGEHKLDILKNEVSGFKNRKKILQNGYSLPGKVKYYQLLLVFYTVQSFRIIEVIRLCLGLKMKRA